MANKHKHFRKIFSPGNIRRIKMLPEAVGVTAQNEFVKNFDRQVFLAADGNLHSALSAQGALYL